MHFTKTSLASGLLLAGNALAIDLDLGDEGSIRDAAKIIAASIVDRYHNASDIPGLFGQPYYFWESGLAWDSLINYWHQTGDDSYNDIIGEALRFQLGEEEDYMPTNQSASLGNDDQATWALAAMTAVEYGFPADVLQDVDTTWADIAIKVFNDQAARWDEETCDGGLRWQIFSFNNGYNYKNTMTNGNFFQLASRLALFTGNTTYDDWSNRVIEWSLSVGLIANETTDIPGAVYDGTSADHDCSSINHLQWTANAGTYLAGSAYLHNATQTRTAALYAPLLSAANETFSSGRNGAPNGTLTEVACAPNNNCNVDQLAFRAVLARAMAQTRDLTRTLPTSTYTVPINISDIANITASQNFTIPAWNFHERINFVLRQSAMGAAAQCVGGDNGTTCGSDWGSSEWDGTEGLGQELSALNVILANIPLTGRLATVNSSATEVSGSGDGDDAAGTGGTNDSGAGDADDAAQSTGGAGHIAVSSMGLMVVVGSMMAFL